MTRRPCGRHRSGPPLTRLALVLVVATACLATAPPAGAGEFIAGGAATRGYFQWAGMAGYAFTPALSDRSTGIDYPLRLEGAFSTRNNVTNMVFSFMPTMRWHIPGFSGNDFGPYISTGPGLHFQASWASLEEFGGVETASETTAKWHVFLGASLARGDTADLIVETRYTIPSELHFDYLLIALRFHPSPH